MRGRWIGLGAAAILAAGALSGCARPSGYTGISVDESGDPVAILAWCGRPPKQIVVTGEPVSDDAPANLKAVVIRAPALTGHTAEVNLRHPDGGWVITNDSLALDDDQLTYYVYGETDSPDDQTEGRFMVADLTHLSPGEVFGQDDADVDQTIDINDFENAVTSQC
jgi:hypothetical protein